MSSAQVGVVLGYIRKLAAAWKDEDLPDNQLLERFAARQDQAAFAALLKRHGPMVLGVCQSVLHNLHDAEDAFQAAFLVLARKAGSIHRREAVSSWLHRVAYHLAVKAQANFARRRDLETRAVTMPSADPLLDMSLRELKAVLNEELQRLPEAYRAPVVLCGLEEKSLEEAARLLGWSKWKVKGRLQRGRDRLRARLRRRGLELSAGLFATVLSTSSASAQVPATLTASTLKAALWLGAGKEPVTGVVSAKVAALVKGASTTMFHSKLKIATALLLAVSAGATGIGLLRHQVLAANQAETRQPESQKQRAQNNGRPAAPPAKREAADTVRVHGRVLDPDGKPLAGAKLYVGPTNPKEPTFPVRATTGEDGRFEFTFASSELDKNYVAHPRGQVLAMAKGYGCDWAPVGPAAKEGELTLRLVKDVPISGRIVDQDAHPVAGAKVKAFGLFAFPGRDPKDVLEDIRQGRIGNSKDWSGPIPGQPKVLTTGADGRIRLAGIGGDRFVDFHIEGPGIATTQINVITRPGDPVAVNQWRYYGAAFEYIALPSRPIRGVVRDGATHKPVAGVAIAGIPTDQDGRYELLGYAKSERYEFEVLPANGQLYFAGRVFVDDTPGLDPLTAPDIKLVSGIPLRGRVTDKATGKPVAQANVEYRLLYPNPEVAKLADFASGYGPRSHATTAADGSFSIVVLPGPGVLGVTSSKRESYMPALVTPKDLKDFFKDKLAGIHTDENFLIVAAGGNAMSAISQPEYDALVLLDPPQKTASLTRDVVLEPGRTVKGSVVGPDGKSLAGVIADGLGGEGVLDSDGGFTVRAINPRRSRPLTFVHKEKSLGFYTVLKGDERGPLTVKLQPLGSATGRIVDKNGQPLADLVLNLPRHGLQGSDAPRAKTDKDGRFRVEGLVPGYEYLLMDASLTNRIATIVVEPGKNKDLGDLDGHVGENP